MMRQTTALIALTVIAASAHGASANRNSASTERPPWTWTSEERIAKRVDPAARSARRSRELSRVRMIAVGFSPINGAEEPELFLPVELVADLVRQTGVGRADTREYYRAAVASHGWNYDRFWDVLQSAAAPYMELLARSGELQRATRGHADLSQLQLQGCRALAQLLDIAHETFGREAFDQFLYTSVAPQLRSVIADDADTADRLRSADGGCR